jgi:uncharacterized protein YndB with AHSA1/START domain
MSTEITASFDFNAPPEVVYNSVTDPNRAARWLPAGVRMSRPGPHRAHVDAAGQSTEYELVDTPADLRLSWRSVRPPHLSGEVRVGDAPAGGSRLDVTVTTADDGPSPAAVRRILGKISDRLHRDVSDNFTAG